MIVVGLDLAYGDKSKHSGTGVATASGTFTIPAPTSAGAERLALMRSTVVAAVHGTVSTDLVRHVCGCFATAYGVHPDLVAIEGYSYGSKFVAHALGELGGVVRLELYDLGIRYIVVPPSSVKRYACGNGNASKDDMLLAAVRRLGYEGNSKDQADAMWVRASALAALDEPIVDVPKTHLTALVAIRKELATVMARTT